MPAAHPLNGAISRFVGNSVVRDPVQLGDEEARFTIEHPVRVPLPYGHESLGDQLPPSSVVKEAAEGKVLARRYVAKSKMMVVADIQLSDTAIQDVVHVRQQRPVEGHEQRPSCVIGTRISQEQRPEHRHRCLARPGRPKDDMVVTRRQRYDCGLIALRTGQARSDLVVW